MKPLSDECLAALVASCQQQHEREMVLVDNGVGERRDLVRWGFVIQALTELQERRAADPMRVAQETRVWFNGEFHSGNDWG